MIAGSDGALLAALIAEAGRGPSGSEDLSDYTGQIVSWDESSGTNVVRVNGTEIPNMRVIQSGIGLSYQNGDVVNILRRGTQWFILGKVGAPGAGAAGQIASNDVDVDDGTTSTSFTDLGAFGPSVSAYISSRRRALVILSVNIAIISDPVSSGFTPGGTASVFVSGASSIPDSLRVESQVVASVRSGLRASFSRAALLDASDGLNSGFNTFTVKYLATRSDRECRFDHRNLTVIPF